MRRNSMLCLPSTIRLRREECARYANRWPIRKGYRLRPSNRASTPPRDRTQGQQQAFRGIRIEAREGVGANAVRLLRPSQGIRRAMALRAPDSGMPQAWELAETVSLSCHAGDA